MNSRPASNVLPADRVRRRGRSALARLLRTYSKPYSGRLILIVVLTTVQAAGNLYLPNLNAAIIDNGVVAGDLAYIWRAGGLMLGVTAGLGVVAVLAVYL